MSAYQVAILGLLVATLSKTYAIGHDIRGDWTRAERAAVTLAVSGGMLCAGLGLGMAL